MNTILRIKVKQPQACYRVPYSFTRPATYPLPPISTVFGFFNNLLGINDMKFYEQLVSKFLIAVAGRYENTVKDYAWLRSLNSTETLRCKNNEISSIGKIVPTTITKLLNVELFLYFKFVWKEGKEKEGENELEERLKFKNILQPLHLGRAEDLISLLEVKKMDKEILKEEIRRDGYYDYFFWVPTKISNVQGVVKKISLYSTIDNYEDTFDYTRSKTFHNTLLKLNNGKIIGAKFLYDSEKELPIFFVEVLSWDGK